MTPLLFFATAAALAILASAVSGLATITALANIAATAGYFLAALTALAIFASTVSGLTTITTLANITATAGYFTDLVALGNIGFRLRVSALTGASAAAAGTAVAFAATAVEGKSGCQ